MVEDEAVELVELGKGRRQDEITPGGLQLLNKIGGAGPVSDSVFDYGIAVLLGLVAKFLLPPLDPLAARAIT